MLSTQGKTSADNILKWFSYFSQKTGFLFHTNCQSLFSVKNKKNIINLSSAELAHRVQKVNWII